MIAEGADVPACGTHRLEQSMDFRADRFCRARCDDDELVHTSNERNPAGDFPGKVPWFLVPPDARRCERFRCVAAIRDNMLLDAERSSAGVVSHPESQVAESVVNLTVIGIVSDSTLIC